MYNCIKFNPEKSVWMCFMLRDWLKFQIVTWKEAISIHFASLGLYMSSLTFHVFSYEQLWVFPVKIHFFSPLSCPTKICFISIFAEFLVEEKLK